MHNTRRTRIEELIKLNSKIKKATRLNRRRRRFPFIEMAKINGNLRNNNNRQNNNNQGSDP